VSVKDVSVSLKSERVSGLRTQGSLGTFTRDEQWTLSQTGNWHSRLLDLNGDGDGLDANEFTDAGTFNTANELTQRSLSGGVTATYTRTYDAVGNLTNDGKDYKFEYDAFGRMVRVRNRSTDALVAEYTCNGLGFRTSWKYDANASGAVDGSDPVYWFTHDERWRVVATYRGSDSDPREVFVWHSAGMDGHGGSSYIDAVVLRQDDTTTAWTDAPDTLNRRIYPLQNWRADVVAVYDVNEGVIAERVKYSAYGVPFCVSAADFDGDGDVDAADNTAYSNANTAGDPSADLNLDGVVDFNDTLAWNNLYNAGETGGRSVLSLSSVRNRIGYAGYQHDPSITGSAQASGQGKYHVRFRVYDAGVGRWTRRDPLGYVDGMSVYEYVRSAPVEWTDSYGSMRVRGVGGGGSAGHSRRTEEQCCADAQRDGLRGTSQAGVICCDGRLVICVWTPSPGTCDHFHPTEAGCSEGKKKVRDCMRLHEQIHRDRHLQQRAAECAQNERGLSRPGFDPGVEPDDAECEAYGEELDCLARKRSECDSLPNTSDRGPCRSVIDHETLTICCLMRRRYTCSAAHQRGRCSMLDGSGPNQPWWDPWDPCVKPKPDLSPWLPWR
jgi:RHS repeat-associated protein